MATKKNLTLQDWQRAGSALTRAWRNWMDAEGMFPEPQFDIFMRECNRIAKMSTTPAPDSQPKSQQPTGEIPWDPDVKIKPDVTTEE